MRVNSTLTLSPTLTLTLTLTLTEMTLTPTLTLMEVFRTLGTVMGTVYGYLILKAALPCSALITAAPQL